MHRRNRLVMTLAALLLALPAPARAVGDEEALAELLGGSEEVAIGRADDGTSETDFPGGVRLINDQDFNYIRNDDARLAFPFRRMKPPDQELENPFEADEVPAEYPNPSGPSFERRASRAEGLPTAGSPTAGQPAAGWSSDFREVAPAEFPVRSIFGRKGTPGRGRTGVNY